MAQRIHGKNLVGRVARAEYIIRARSIMGGRRGCRTLRFVRVRGLTFPGVQRSMRNPLRRYYGRSDLHFVTFSCYRRRPFLGTRRPRDRFVRILDEVRSRHAFRLIWICGDAGTRSPAAQRSKESHAIESTASAETKGFPSAPREREEVCGGAMVVGVSWDRTGARGVLAETILRFQRLLAEEAPGETGVHACESGGTKTGGSSKGVAVEQLVTLREWRERIDTD